MHYAEIEPTTNKVLRVVVSNSHEWLVKNLGGTWARTYYSTPGKVYAGIGYIYYPEHGNFSPPQPYPSWTLNTTTFQWEPPVPYPSSSEGNEDTLYYVWNEEDKAWVAESV